MSGELKHLSDEITAGRPRRYKTVAAMEKAIDEYFDYCDKKTKEIHSEKMGDMTVADPEPYTVSGLAYWLGMTRHGLLYYLDLKDEVKQDFLSTIKKAKARIEGDVDRRLSSKDTFTPGLIFTAKNNLGWQDTQKVEGVQEIRVTTRKHKLNARNDT